MFNAVLEAIVRVMDQKIAGPNGGENVASILDRGDRQRGPWRVFQRRYRERRNLEQGRIVQFIRQIINIFRRKFEPLAEQFPDRRISSSGKFKTHYGFESAPADLFLDNI